MIVCKKTAEGIVTVAADQLKKNGSFKLAGAFNLKLKLKLAGALNLNLECQ